MANIQLHGTHGTSKWRAEQIEKTGFRMSKDGLRGKGIYFWYHEKNNGEHDALELGDNWVRTIIKHNPKHFEDDPTSLKESAIIFVSIKLEKKYLLDLNNPTLNFALNKYLVDAFKKMERVEKDWSDEDHHMRDRIKLIDTAYKTFIKKWCKKSGIDFKAVLVRVRAPDNSYYKARGDINAFQQPLCITIISYKGVDININKIEHTGIL